MTKASKHLEQVKEEIHHLVVANSDLFNEFITLAHKFIELGEGEKPLLCAKDDDGGLVVVRIDSAWRRNKEWVQNNKNLANQA